MKSANNARMAPVLRSIRAAPPLHWRIPIAPDQDIHHGHRHPRQRTPAPAGFTGTLTDKLREQFAEGLDGQTLRPDFTMEQPVHRYTAADHATWRTLYDRQEALLPGRACDEFLQGLSTLGMSREGVPSFDRLNETLMRATGWQIVAVPGLVPDEVFFEHLANRRFPASWWMRRPDQLDYLQEPDGFHDIFGHVPLLINPVFADYMQAYGQGGLKAARLGALDMLARLYWYTVEFGLIRTPAGLRIYGAGIVSSKSGRSTRWIRPAPTASASTCTASCARATASTPSRRPTS